jgi:hypothetical protein
MHHTARCKATGSANNKHFPCEVLHTHCNGRTTQCTRGAVLGDHPAHVSKSLPAIAAVFGPRVHKNVIRMVSQHHRS